MPPEKIQLGNVPTSNKIQDQGTRSSLLFWLFRRLHTTHRIAPCVSRGPVNQSVWAVSRLLGGDSQVAYLTVQNILLTSTGFNWVSHQTTQVHFYMLQKVTSGFRCTLTKKQWDVCEKASGVAKATEFYVNAVMMDEVLKGENVQDRLLYRRQRNASIMR
jgi:hypothetical protein